MAGSSVEGISVSSALLYYFRTMNNVTHFISLLSVMMAQGLVRPRQCHLNSRRLARYHLRNKLNPRTNEFLTGHTFRRSAAGAFGPDLAKKLTQMVKMEKNLMRSMELVSRERMEAAQQLSIWGESCDDDVSDVTDKLGVLLYEIGELEDQFVDRYDQYRVTMKSIRNIEVSVQPSRDSELQCAQVPRHDY
jgi:hypothetical protein